jgi:hypothetical protein
MTGGFTSAASEQAGKTSVPCPYCWAALQPGDSFCPICGSRLEGHRSPPVSLPPAPLYQTPMREQPPPNRTYAYLALACAAAVIAGSLGPWVTITAAFFGTIDVRGTKGDGDLTLGLSLAAGLLMALACSAPRRRWPAVLAAVGFLAAAAIGAYDWNNVSDRLADSAGEEFIASAGVGWGLYLVTIGAVAGAIFAGLHIRGVHSHP